MESKYSYYSVGKQVMAVNNSEYPGINTPDDLYDALKHVWCEYTCAPRMRERWTRENMTLGQCSITAFLFQDIFGGNVYGVPLNDGGYHCYNVVGDSVFDLTSEQFEKELYYSKHNSVQLRDVHFSKEEKKQRYDYLCENLANYLKAHTSKDGFIYEN